MAGDSGGLSSGEVAGIVIGVLLAVAILAAIGVMVWKPEIRHRASGLATDTIVRFTGNSTAHGFDPSDIMKNADGASA